MNKFVYSYLEICAAFQKYKFLRPDINLDLIHGGCKVYKTIDNVPSRIFFQTDSFLLIQHHQKGKKSVIEDRWNANQAGRDDAFIFVPENGGILRWLLQKERNYNLAQYPNAFKGISTKDSSFTYFR